MYHNTINKFKTAGLIAIFSLGIAEISACGGGGGGGSTPPATSTSSIELIDPTPGAGDQFGRTVVILANGNIVVSDLLDSSVASHNGAVHLYNSTTQTPIASFYGEAANDLLGLDGIVALANSNFVIVSSVVDVNSIADVGSVMLIDGTTGAQIGATLTGVIANDQLGSKDVTPLPNNNFVIASSSVDTAGPGGIIDAGSITLVNGVTGALIGTPIVGDTNFDNLGSGSVTALLNNNFVVTSPNDDEGVVNASSVRLVDGATGLQIGATLAGDVSDDNLGSLITVLPNNNFVVTSPSDNEGGIVQAGSVRLFNGATGVQVGTTIAGDVTGDVMGSAGITVLADNNFVISSPRDSEGGVVAGGSVRVIDSATGAQIGGSILGDTDNDHLGSEGVTALANNNFVIASSEDNVAGIIQAGSVRLFNGSTVVQISSTIAGDIDDDRIGYYPVTALPNNNFVIASPYDNESGIVDIGSVLLVNGTTGVPVSSPQLGETEYDIFGYDDITVLANNNFVIDSRYDNNGVIQQAGSVRLVNGVTGAQIGTPILGNALDDELGSDGVTALANNNFVVISELENADGVVNAGTVRVVNGVTGEQISILNGSVAGDVSSANVTESALGDFYILSLPSAFNHELAGAGRVQLIAE